MFKFNNYNATQGKLEIINNNNNYYYYYYYYCYCYCYSTVVVTVSGQEAEVIRNIQEKLKEFATKAQCQLRSVLLYSR